MKPEIKEIIEDLAKLNRLSYSEQESRLLVEILHQKGLINEVDEPDAEYWAWLDEPSDFQPVHIDAHFFNLDLRQKPPVLEQAQYTPYLMVPVEITRGRKDVFAIILHDTSNLIGFKREDVLICRRIAEGDEVLGKNAIVQGKDGKYFVKKFWPVEGKMICHHTTLHWEPSPPELPVAFILGFVRYSRERRAFASHFEGPKKLFT
ncbi:MAG: hypothetical protein K1Y36_28570 [Blastocatellia bacterium]|nr:hypothetical protein [Blastocatellia bacterium]